MDGYKLVVLGIGVLGLVLAHWFVSTHWQDIKDLAIVAMVLGGSFALTIGGIKISARG
jgi:hypothetical protein